MLGDKMNWKNSIPANLQGLLDYAQAGGTEGWAELVNRLVEMISPEDVPWDRNIINDLARNYNCPGLLKNGWWQRTIDQISHVTVHHTKSDSVHAFTEWYVGTGRPSTPYSIWVTQTGEILLCNALTEGNWHDHTGHKNIHLSIGMAGNLHIHTPCDVQLHATAEVCAWVINNSDIPLVDGVDKIKGHLDWYNTACPGWLGTGEGKPSGFWKPRFYKILNEWL